MRSLYLICFSLSWGLLLGFSVGGLKAAFFKRPHSPRQIQAVRSFLRKLAAVLKYVTFLLLALGFIWCCFFLVMALSSPELAEYADNMAELIVSVLTVISILFAFVEFLKPKDGPK